MRNLERANFPLTIVPCAALPQLFYIHVVCRCLKVRIVLLFWWLFLRFLPAGRFTGNGRLFCQKNRMHALNSIVAWKANLLVWSALPSSFFDTLEAQKGHLLYENSHIHSAHTHTHKLIFSIFCIFAKTHYVNLPAMDDLNFQPVRRCYTMFIATMRWLKCKYMGM